MKKHWIDATAEGLRRLSFMTLIGLCSMSFALLTGCEQKPATPVPENPADKDIKIDAPGVDIEVDRTPDGDGKRDVDIDVNPGGAPGVDVDVDRK
jgi:hypothetical protein